MIELFNNKNLTGEIFLTPLKTCGEYYHDMTLGHINGSCSDTAQRVALFIMAVGGGLFALPLAAVGMLIKMCCSELPDEGNVPNPNGPPPVQLPPIPTKTNLIDYPGDLSPEEKSNIEKSDINFEQNKSTMHIYFHQRPFFNVEIRCQDLFTSSAEVIVNAANSHLGGGGGIDGAIHARGGNSYKQGHAQLQRQYNSNYTLGHAAIIPSGDIANTTSITDVIVVAGPQRATSALKEKQLYSCYFNALKLAHEKGKTSIALPTISTGIFGFPKDRGAQISLRAIYSFVLAFPESPLKKISIHSLLTDIEHIDNYKQALTLA